MSETKRVEKTQYLGELRLIGRVLSPDNKELGFVVMKESTYDMTAYNINQIKQLLTQYKFVNAKLENGNIVNTECAMDKLPKYTQQLKCQTPNKLTIISKVFDADTEKVLGYKVWLCGDNIIDCNMDDMFRLVSQGYELVNAKVVTVNGTQHFSAIKQEFTKTYTKVVSVKTEPVKIDKKKAHRLMQRGEKLSNFMFDIIFRDFIAYGTTRCSARYAIKDAKGVGYYMMPKTDVQLMLKALKKKYTSGYEASLLTSIEQFTSNLKLQDECSVRNLTENDVLAYCLAGQFTPYKSYLLSSMTEGYRSSKIDSNVCKMVKHCSNLWLPDVALVLSTIIANNEIAKDKASKKKNKTHIMGSVNFKSERTIHEMGFTIKASEDGQTFDTTNSCVYTLHYIGKDIKLVSDSQVKDLFASSGVFGDICVIAQIDKYLRQSEFKLAEMCLGIMSMYNYDLAKKYIDMVKDKYPQVTMMIPHGDVASTMVVDDEKFKVYYESGFNVYKTEKDEHYINYRAKYSSTKPIIDETYPSLSTLVGVLGNIVSDDLDFEYMNKNIGTLRHI